MKKANAANLRVLCSILMLMIFAAPVKAQDITSNLIGHWKLNEGSGASLIDSSSNANTGTWTDGSGDNVVEESIDGRLNTSIDFDGNNDVINVADDPSLDITGTELTISAWINWGGGSSTLIEKIDDFSSNRRGYLIRIGGSETEWTCFLGDDTFPWPQVSIDGVPANEWAHVSCVYDGNNIIGYLNGAEVNRSARTGALLTTSGQDLNIGREVANINTRTMDGAIDDLRIYDRALSPSDIKALYQQSDGSIRYKQETQGLEYFNNTEWVHAGLGSYSPNAASFDGTTDNLYYASPLTGVNDGNKVTGSFWARRNPASNGTLTVILQGIQSKVLVQWEVGDRVFTKYKNSEGDDVLAIRSTNTYTDGNWHHVMWSADMNIPGSARMYIDGVDVTNNTQFGDTNPGNGTNNILDFSIADYRIGSNNDASAAFFNGDIADFWIDFNTYIDLTDPDNRRKFISDNNMPMYLGPDGSLPLGKAPDIFLSGVTANWHTNKGTGGGFTENGTLADATSQPGGTSGDLGWATVGTALSLTAVGQPTITHLSSDTIAFIDSNQEDLRTYTWDGSNWSQTGNDLNISGVGNPSITMIGFNTIAFIDRDLDELRTYSWNGTDWSQIGSSLSIANLTGDVAIEALDTNIVAYVDANNKELRTYVWNGSSWSQSGSSLNVGNIFDPKMTLINDNTIALYGSLIPNGVRTFRWDGSTWSAVGNDLAEGFSKAELTTLTTNRIALYGESTNELRVYDWDGQDWTQVGTGLNIPQGFSAFTAMGTIDRNTISFIDGANDNLETYRFEDLTPCTNPSGQPGDILYNTDQQVMQYCNGTDWVAMGPVGGTSGTGCLNPSGTAGDLIYNNDYDLLQYCNADDWIGVGLGLTGSTTVLSSLVAHWRLDETTGTAVADVTGNHNGSTSDASPTWLPSGGVSAGALDIDSDETIDTGAWDVNGTGITLAGWLYLESATQDPRIICKTSGFTDSDSDWCWLWDNGTGEMEIRLTTINGYEDQRTSGLDYFNNYGNEWHHFAVTYDANSNGIVFYLDGVQIDTATHTSGGPLITGSGEAVALGNNSVGGLREWDGLLDDLRVYDTPLTAAQIFDVYAEANPCASGITLTPGQLCEDGSIFAGGGLYVAKTNQSAALQWKTTQGIDDIAPDSFTDGSENSTNRSGVLADFPAFEICENLSLLGHTDWYLPARDELLTLETNRTAIDSNAIDSLTGFFWSSSEFDVNTVYQVNMGSGAAAANKTNARTVRCVRK